MNLLVVLPVCEKDAHLALRNLEWCISMDQKADFPCLLVHDSGFAPTEVESAARNYFSSLTTFCYDPWRGEPQWPFPQNWAWQTVARHIESTKTLQLPWLWWEADAVPLRPGWLITLATAYAQGQRPFAGPVCTNQGITYMAGIAIYPPSISRHAEKSLIARSRPWDIIGSQLDGFLRSCHDVSSLICHTPDLNNTVFTSRQDVSASIPESSVLFHKCKDGSLLDVLQGRINQPIGETDLSRLKSVNLLDRNVPSFTEQTQWPSGYFTFPCSPPHTAYFNCSIAEHENALHLFTRRERRHLEQTTNGALQGTRNDLAIWRIRDNMTLAPTPLLPTCPTRYPHEQWEDPRVMRGDDGYHYVSFATWVHYKPWKIRQALTRLTPDWRKIEPLWEPPIGGNARKPEAATSHEKNWIWFQRESQWHMQYSINPGDIHRVDRTGAPVERWQTKDVRLPWEFGLPLRGGTPPILVGDEYWAFFHTCTVWQKPKRRYYMGLYTFDAAPPFAIRRMTTQPLLVGSDQDYRSLGGPLVIFPNGAIRRGDEWLIVFGVNDEACGWIKIPHAELETRLVNVQPKGLLARAADAIGLDL